MMYNGLRFSIASHSAWAPGLTTPAAWDEWGQAPFLIGGNSEPPVAEMPPMLRRRAGFLGKMALEAAYRCLDGRADVPAVFCSRHGDVARAVGLLGDLAQGEPLSPAAFGLAVHNASAGLFSIARGERANHIAMAAGASTIEHGVIEACGLLADGAPMVLLVAYDCPLPAPLSRFADCDEQPHAWAWLMVPPGAGQIGLGWTASTPGPDHAGAQNATPGSLEVLRFFLTGAAKLERDDGMRRWTWARHG